MGRFRNFLLTVLTFEWTVLGYSLVTARHLYNSNNKALSSPGDLDICGTDQQFVLTSFGACGCCVRSSLELEELFLRSPSELISKCPTSVRKDFRNACCNEQAFYLDVSCLKPDSRIQKRIFDMPEHHAFVGQHGKIHANLNLTTGNYVKRSSCSVATCFRIETLPDDIQNYGKNRPKINKIHFPFP